MTESPALRRTPLAPLQEKIKARFVEFGGWDLPVLYTSIVEEAEAVRTGAGLFDVSHMGRFFVSGPEAHRSLQALLSREIGGLAVGRQRYSLLLNAEGGIIDDLMISRTAEEEFLLVVNAGNLDADWDWIDSHLPEAVHLVDRSPDTLMIALQGPDSERIFQSVTGMDVSDKKFLDVVTGIFASAPFVASRSGYTGEDGFEFTLPIDAGLELWEKLIEAGARPCGLGARDLLRLEVAYPLYGHELSLETLPTECGLEWVLSKKTEYLGRKAVESKPPATELLGFVCASKSIPRADYPIEVNGQPVGRVTSGGLSTRLPNGFGLARVALGTVEDTFDLVVRNNRIPCKRVPTPFIPDQVKR